MASLIILIKDGEQLQHIYEAESQLSQAGITFDTSSDVKNGKVLNRVWELDWSLRGAEIKAEVKEVI